MKYQTLRSQKGEIDFRKKLSKQQISGHHIFNDEFESKEINKILKRRMDVTLNDFEILKTKTRISPYIELGAERCQRSLIIENVLDAKGAAIDISYDMLNSCKHYKKVFKKRKIPLRVCCDANTLPFRSGSVPFIFCYQTLHHFPDPSPVINEVYRVLTPGGSFYFNEEPFKKVLHLNLYKSSKIYSKKAVNASILRKISDYFLSEQACNEVEYGVIENDGISLKEWKKSLALFNDKDVSLKSMRFINSKLYGLRNPLTFLMAYLFGGGISGLVFKRGKSVNKDIQEDIEKCLVCPECLMEDNGRKTHSALIRHNLFFVCIKCKKRYPVIEGIVFLFTKKALNKLYPKVYSRLWRDD
ncbi:MAG TPA: class I SAM-dependent methyltransferase [Candidatus Nanoarchaeia archaeon]|nr:class I SAM-dependent methyltransferase [Candidatus Nanoarchaeia archaeon]